MARYWLPRSECCTSPSREWPQRGQMAIPSAWRDNPVSRDAHTFPPTTPWPQASTTTAASAATGRLLGRSRWKGRTAAPRRSARPRTPPGRRRCRRRLLQAAVELRRREKRRDGAQNLIRPAQLSVLLFQLGDALLVLAGR